MTKKRQFYFWFTVFIILNLVFVFLAIFPLISKIKLKSSEVFSIKNERVFLEKKIEKIIELKKQEDKIETFLKKINEIFAKKDFPFEFISFLEQTGKECGTPFLKIAPIQKEVKEKESVLYFQITIASTFSGTACFLEKIETASFLIDISEVNFSKLTENELKTKGFSAFSSADIKATFIFSVLSK